MFCFLNISIIQNDVVNGWVTVSAMVASQNSIVRIMQSNQCRRLNARVPKFHKILYTKSILRNIQLYSSQSEATLTKSMLFSEETKYRTQALHIHPNGGSLLDLRSYHRRCVRLSTHHLGIDQHHQTSSPPWEFRPSLCSSCS